VFRLQERNGGLFTKHCLDSFPLFQEQGEVVIPCWVRRIVDNAGFASSVVANSHLEKSNKKANWPPVIPQGPMAGTKLRQLYSHSMYLDAIVALSLQRGADHLQVQYALFVRHGCIGIRLTETREVCDMLEGMSLRTFEKIASALCNRSCNKGI
jgi:hypothetical protein